MKYIVCCRNVGRMYGQGKRKVRALKGIDLRLLPQRLIMLKGRSGSGKTTLINLLGALDQPTEGDIYFAEKNLNTLSEKEKSSLRKKRMAFIFQSFALLPSLSAYENVEFGLRIAGVPAKERKHRAREALKALGVAEREHFRPRELTRGEKQRVAIARAISQRPLLLLADEPTTELDDHTTLKVMKIFRDLVRKQSLTIVMTTHDPKVTEMADEVYELEKGRLVESFDRQFV